MSNRDTFARRVISFALFAAATASFAADASKTYHNPVIPNQNMADPDVIRVDGLYYLYATSHGRGYDVFVSEDLVHWENKGLAFDDKRRGAWAPDVFHDSKDRKFYLYYTDNDPNSSHGPLNKEVGIAVASSPLGPFEDKTALVTNAIDAHLFRDDNGKMYLYYVNLKGGFKILAQPMQNPTTTEGEVSEVIHPTEPWEMKSGRVTEGPFMLKHNGVYYLMYSGTGADSPNYGIGYATASSPLGPFHKFEGNPIAHRTNKIFGPGHHCVVQGPDGKLWMVYHQKVDQEQNYNRFIAIDPLWFDDQGVIHTRVSRDQEEPAP
jgi:xylan 1,4-beta-xylosidase